MTDISPTQPTPRGLAVITGASSGIGLELARLIAEDGYDQVLCADRPLDEAVGVAEPRGVTVETVQADLATEDGVQALLERGRRPAGPAVGGKCGSRPG